jgi:hypothetical protein
MRYGLWEMGCVILRFGKERGGDAGDGDGDGALE